MWFWIWFLTYLWAGLSFWEAGKSVVGPLEKKSDKWLYLGACLSIWPIWLLSQQGKKRP